MLGAIQDNGNGMKNEKDLVLPSGSFLGEKRFFKKPGKLEINERIGNSSLTGTLHVVACLKGGLYIKEAGESQEGWATLDKGTG